MNPHDYFISVDENGEPYLEHALFGKGGQKKDHKYYARAQDKGRWRYFYSPEEFRLWSSGSPKKKSASEKMKSAFKQLKETGRKAVDTAADKLGVDERQALQNANRFNRARRQKAYDETPLGKAENAADRIAEQVSSKVDELGNKLKTKSERMREELRKKTSQTAEDVQEKVKEKIREKAADVKETYEHNKHQFDKAKEMEKAEAERQEKLANRPKAHEKPDDAEPAKEGAMRLRSMKSSFAEYKDGDPDFDDSNYKEENRIGDTDFFVHKRKDGTSVLLEEDMKWVLPEGVDGSSPEMKQAIESWQEMRQAQNQAGMRRTASEIQKELTDIIDATVVSYKKVPGTSEFKTYDQNDPDFSDANYDRAERIGDSDFFTFKRKDGTSVIREEDMKWVLPKGVDGNSPEIRKAIKELENKEFSGWWNFQKDAKEAIDQAISRSKKSSNEPWVSQEYRDEIEFNSRKNDYFGR